MPIYEFQCPKCQEIFEDIQVRTDDTGPSSCPKCSSPGPVKIPSLTGGCRFPPNADGLGGWEVSKDGKFASKRQQGKNCDNYGD